MLWSSGKELEGTTAESEEEAGHRDARWLVAGGKTEGGAAEGRELEEGGATTGNEEGKKRKE
jgi:hypothetical protein